MSIVESFNLVFALLRVIICRCFACRKSIPLPQFEVLCIGPCQVGKSALLSILNKQDFENLVPTSGFEIRACKLDKCVLNIKEIGGSNGIRKYWKHYYKPQIQGFIYILDNQCDNSEIEKSMSDIKEASSSMPGVPALILINKKDTFNCDVQHTNQLVSSLNLQEAMQGRPWFHGEFSTSDFSTILKMFEKFSDLLIMASKKSQRK